jgi:hypothetical protein
MYKAVYQLTDIEKFLYLEDNYREIAETLGISEVNARVKMNRIKGKLKKIKSLRSMKELDLLKDWQKNKDSFEQVSEIEIYRMIHKNHHLL